MTPNAQCWNDEFLSSALSVHISPTFTAASSLQYVKLPGLLLLLLVWLYYTAHYKISDDVLFFKFIY